MRWPEERIREELKRLDKITGLHGGELPIEFSNSKTALGMYCSHKTKGNSFRFSTHYFESPTFSQAEALDTIRHEYAHYMNDKLNGSNSDGSHGKTWRSCCRKVGARPIRLYNPHINEIHLRQEQANQEKQSKLFAYLDSLKPGMSLQHPSFGIGSIVSIDKAPVNSRITIQFAADHTCRHFSAQWIAQHCFVSS